MGEIDRLIFYAAILMGLLIIVAYFTGFTSDINQAGGVINKIITTLQGRNASGQFAAYPTGVAA